MSTRHIKQCWLDETQQSQAGQRPALLYERATPTANHLIEPTAIRSAIECMLAPAAAHEQRYLNKMNETAEPPPKQLHFGLLLLISFALFNLGFIVDQTFSWNDHFGGFINGIYHIMLFGITWCVSLLPWSILILALYRWRKWKRFRAYWVVAPAVIALMISVGSLILNPPTPSNRFRSFAESELPQNIKNLHYFFSGGGIADFHDEYYFETTPTEVDRLIAEMRLSKGGGYNNAAEVERSHLLHRGGLPDTDVWAGSKVFARNDEDTGWHYELRVDSSKTKVFVVIGCI